MKALLQQALDALNTCRVMGADVDGNYTIEITPKVVSVAIAALQAALSQSEPDLTPYGYAPGGYMLTCKTCGKTSDGADKRAYHCKECATRLAQHEGLADELKAMDAPEVRRARPDDTEGGEI